MANLSTDQQCKAGVAVHTTSGNDGSSPSVAEMCAQDLLPLRTAWSAARPALIRAAPRFCDAVAVNDQLEALWWKDRSGNDKGSVNVYDLWHELCWVLRLHCGRHADLLRAPM